MQCTMQRQCTTKQNYNYQCTAQQNDRGMQPPFQKNRCKDARRQQPAIDQCNYQLPTAAMCQPLQQTTTTGRQQQTKAINATTTTDQPPTYNDRPMQSMQ